MKQKTCWGVTADRIGRTMFSFSFKGFGLIACEQNGNANAPCDWKLGVQLKDKEEFYIASQMEDGSIKESSSDDFKPLSDFLQINDRFGTLNAKYGKILLTLSTRDGKKKTYAVKDVNVKNDNELEFILGPGPNPNDVPFSNMAEEMGFFVWYSGDERLNPSLWSYVNWKLEFPGLSVYNASEDKLEIKWSDVDVVFTGNAPVAFAGDVAAFAGYAAHLFAGDVPAVVVRGADDAPLFAVDIPFARDAATPWYLFFWVQVQIVNEMPIKLFGRDRKGRRMSMVRKVSGYKVDKGKLTLELSSKGLKAKSGDREANMILKGFKSGNYRNIDIIAFDTSSRLSATGSRYSYSAPALPGVIKKGKDGNVRVAFKAGKEKALRYDRETGLISSMDVERFVDLESELELLIQREPDDKEPCVYPYARCSKCGECDIQAKLIGLKKVSEYTWVGGVEFMGEFMGDIVNIAGSGEVVRMRLAWTDKI